LGSHDLDCRDAFKLQFLPRVFERLLSEREGLLIDACLLVGAHQVPVDVLDLRDGRDYLILESNVGNFLVVSSDVEIAQIRTNAESGETFLLDLKTKSGVQAGRQIKKRAVRCLPGVCEPEADAGSGRECLAVDGVHRHGIQLEQWNPIDLPVSEWRGLMLGSAVQANQWIV